jgi:hypothetical protein
MELCEAIVESVYQSCSQLWWRNNYVIPVVARGIGRQRARQSDAAAAGRVWHVAQWNGPEQRGHGEHAQLRQNCGRGLGQGKEGRGGGSKLVALKLLIEVRSVPVCILL